MQIEKRSSVKTASMRHARCMNTHISPEDGLHNTSEAQCFFQVVLAAEPNDDQMTHNIKRGGARHQDPLIGSGRFESNFAMGGAKSCTQYS